MSEVVDELDSDGESVFAVRVPALERATEARIAEHVDEHARAAEAGMPLPLFRLGRHVDDPGPVTPPDDDPLDPLLEAFEVPEGWGG
jgi:hypothetical protein